MLDQSLKLNLMSGLDTFAIINKSFYNFRFLKNKPQSQDGRLSVIRK